MVGEVEAGRRTRVLNWHLRLAGLIEEGEGRRRRSESALVHWNDDEDDEGRLREAKGTYMV